MSSFNGRDSLLYDEKLVSKKSELPLILFYFKGENKTGKKTLKNLLHSFLENCVFKKSNLGSGIGLPIGNVLLKGRTPLKSYRGLY